jgi:hypothetical protein
MSNYDPAKKRMLSETECREDEIVAFLLWICRQWNAKPRKRPSIERTTRGR